MEFRCVWHRKAPLEIGGFRAMARQPQTRAPHTNHGAWVLPLQVDATAAAVVRDQGPRRACPSMGEMRPNPRCQLARERLNSEISGFTSQIATRGPNATGGRDPPWRSTCGLDPPRTSHGCGIYAQCPVKKTALHKKPGLVQRQRPGRDRPWAWLLFRGRWGPGGNFLGFLSLGGAWGSCAPRGPRPTR